MSEAPADVGRAVGTTDDRLVARWWPTTETWLTGADLISLIALSFAWGAVMAFLRGEPNVGLVAMFAAYGFDKLDGYYARRFDCSSPTGRLLDSFVDVFVYLLTGALLFHVALAPTVAVSTIVGFLLVAFGGLRLVRFNAEGFGTEGDTSYYRGLTVVHANLVVVANYFLLQFVPVWNGWLAAAMIAIVAPLMLSNYRSYKTWGTQAGAGVLGVVGVGLAIVLELG